MLKAKTINRKLARKLKEKMQSLDTFAKVPNASLNYSAALLAIGQYSGVKISVHNEYVRHIHEERDLDSYLLTHDFLAWLDGCAISDHLEGA